MEGLLPWGESLMTQERRMTVGNRHRDLLVWVSLGKLYIHIFVFMVNFMSFLYP